MKPITRTTREIDADGKSEDFRALYDRWLRENTDMVLTHKYVEAIRVGDRVLSLLASELGRTPACIVFREAGVTCLRTMSPAIEDLLTVRDHQAVMRAVLTLTNFGRQISLAPNGSYDFYRNLCWLLDLRTKATREEFGRWMIAMAKLKDHE